MKWIKEFDEKFYVLGTSVNVYTGKKNKGKVKLLTDRMTMIDFIRGILIDLRIELQNKRVTEGTSWHAETRQYYNKGIEDAILILDKEIH